MEDAAADGDGEHGRGSQAMDLQRWHPDFDAEDKPIRLRQTLWRKSSQWFALSRSHAELVVNDTEVEAIFSTGCYSRPYDQVIGSYVALSPQPSASASACVHCALYQSCLPPPSLSSE